MRTTPVIVISLFLAGCSDDAGVASNVGPVPSTDAGDGSVTVDAASEAGRDGGSDTGSDTTVTTDAGDSAVEASEDGSSEGGDASAPVIHSVHVPTGGISARWRFEEAYRNVNDGDWYRDSHNETATLAWGESYVMMALAAMFRATGSPEYLDRLVWHGDGVLAQRDDRRGVADYRSVSGACWQNQHYQPNDEPYCYVVHSGMIGYPLVELARLVAESGLGSELAYDGSTFSEKAADYVQAAEETVAYHADQWNDDGYYAFRSDATFLGYPGRDLPLNQSNTMGRLLVVLHEMTGDASYLDKATKLAQRFDSQITTGSGGEYLWNYWGGAYASPGEDISHAAINVDFAAMCAERGVVFDASDLEGFARTFVDSVYVDDGTLHDNVGGGGTNGSSYRPQAGRWLRLTTVRTGVYTAVREIFEADYVPSGVGSGSVLFGWAYLAEYEPIHRDHVFYYVDWMDPNPSGQGDWREAEVYGANVLTIPPDFAAPSVMTLPVDVPRRTSMQQWDGTDYHTVAVWNPSGGAATRWVPYEPRWPFEYWNGGVLYQFADTFVAGDGIQVRESDGFELPQITSAPATQGIVGAPYNHTAQGDGSEPVWWALTQFPSGARIDSASGAIDWTPAAPGDYPVTVRLQNDFGHADQSFVVQVP